MPLRMKKLKLFSTAKTVILFRTDTRPEVLNLSFLNDFVNLEKKEMEETVGM